VRGRTCVLFAVAAVAASAPIAAAAPPWEPPRTVARSTGELLLASTIDFGAAGNALLSWVVASAGAPETVFATMLRDGSVVGSGRLTGALTTGPEIYGRDRVVMLRGRPLLRPSRRTSTRRYRLDALFGTTRSPLGGGSRRVSTFAAFPGSSEVAMGTNNRGDVAVAWVEPRGRESSPSTYRLRAALGREDRGFGRPQTLASWPSPRIDDSLAVTVAYGAGGDLLVAFTMTRREGRRERRLVAARVRRRGGAFGRATVLGSRQASTELTAAVAPDGRMVVAWGSQDGGEGAERPWVVQAAVRPAGRRFARAQLLDPGDATERVPGRVALGMSRDGRATLAWSNARGRRFPPTYPVRTASTGRSGGFGRVTQLAENGGVHDLAVASDGSAVVTWSPYDPEEELPAPLYAQVRPSGAPAFGAVEQVSPPDATVFGSDVAYDPRTGRPVAVWITLGATSELQLAARTG
jgi:hypothetical protein